MKNFFSAAEEHIGVQTAKNDMVRFSIIIPTLNEEHYVPKLLDDLANQEFRDFEVIIVDGRSKDKTVQKTLEFEYKIPNLKILESNKRNVAYQRNLGAKNATGKYILFFDADTRLPAYFLEGVKYKTTLTGAEIFTSWCKVDSDKSADRMIERYMNISNEIGHAVEFPMALGAFIGITKTGFKKTNGFDVNAVPLEDGKFVRTAYAKGLKYALFRDPKFIYSLRRFRAIGKLNSVQKYASLHLKRIAKLPLNQEIQYPMGGYPILSGTPRSVFKDFQANFKRFLKNPRAIKRVREIMDLFGQGINGNIDDK